MTTRFETVLSRVVTQVTTVVSMHALARLFAWTIPVGPTVGETYQFSVGTTAQSISLARWTGRRILIVADGKFAAIFGTRGELLPDPATGTGAIDVDAGALVFTQTYVEHAVVRGRDEARVIAAAANTNMRIYPVSMTFNMWLEELRR